MTQFNNTTSKNGLIQRCEDYTNIGDGNISGDSTLLAKFTSHINETYQEIIREVMMAHDTFDWDDSNYSTYPIGTAPLAAGQRDYPLPASLNLLSIKRIDVTYDGTNWYRATPLDSSEVMEGLGNDDTVDGRYSRTEPRYDATATGFWLYPRATTSEVAAGASFRIEFTREADEFTTADNTQEPGIDRPFHDLLALGASLKYAIAKDQSKAANLKTLFDEGIEQLRRYYGKRQRDAQLMFNPQIPNYR